MIILSSLFYNKMKYLLTIIVAIIQVSGKVKLELRYTETNFKGGFDVNGHIKGKFVPAALLEHSNEDIVVSPIPIMIGIAQLAVGASKRTLEELEAAIGFTKEGIIEDPTTLIQVIADDSSVFLQSVKLYISSRFDLKKDYTNIIKNTFHRYIDKLTFTSKESTCRINKWFAYSTYEYVKHAITETATSKITGILMVSSVSYMNKWETPFQWSEKETFYTENGPIRVQMMYLKIVLPYSDDNNFESQIIDLPVQDKNLQFIIILPKHREGVYSVIKSLNEYGFNVLGKDINKLEMTEVEIYLPRFEVATKTELSSVMKKIGLESIFKPPGLAMMVEGQTVTVNSLINSGVIVVNEEGIGPNVVNEDNPYAKPVQYEENIPVYKGKQFRVKYPFFFLLKSGEEVLLAGIYNGKDGELLFEGPTEKNYFDQYNDDCPKYDPMEDRIID